MLHRFYLTFIFIFSLGSISGYAGFVEEKAAIDAYEQDPSSFIKQQIQDMNALLHNSKVAKEDPHFQRAKALYGDPTQQPKTFKEAANLGGLTYLNHLVNEPSPDATTLLRVARTVSMLLSPEVFDETYEVFDIPILQAVKGQAHFLNSLGLHQATFHQDTSQNSAVFQTSYFKPLVRLGKDAVFTMKAFLDALSKGIFLLGLPEETSHVHGGLYTSPATVFSHDLGHINQFIHKAYKPNQQQDFVSKMGQLAGQVNTFIAEKIEAKDQDKAYLAAFYLFHEQNLVRGRTRFLKGAGTSSNFQWLKTLKMCFYATLSSRFDMISESDPFFITRDSSDYAKAICEVYPEAKADIFPASVQNPDLDYDKKRALRWNRKLMTWFWDKVVELKFEDDL